jgi:hypothetical protein
MLVKLNKTLSLPRAVLALYILIFGWTTLLYSPLP